MKFYDLYQKLSEQGVQPAPQGAAPQGQPAAPPAMPKAVAPTAGVNPAQVLQPLAGKLQELAQVIQGLQANLQGAPQQHVQALGAGLTQMQNAVKALTTTPAPQQQPVATTTPAPQQPQRPPGA